VSRASRGVIGSASRGVVAQIDERLKTLEQELSGHEQLLAERGRLQAARATLLGQTPTGQIAQQDIATYLQGHPGSKPREIAQALGVDAGRVSAHLYRAKTTRFIKRGEGWHLRPGKETP
jgi:DNA-directed RNA polymerase specialized sigma24 family protein